MVLCITTVHNVTVFDTDGIILQIDTGNLTRLEVAFQLLESFSVGTPFAHFQNILELAHLFEHLFESLIPVDQEPDAAHPPRSHGHAEDSLHIAGSSGEQPADV